MIDEKRKTKISKFLSLVLRHKPETIGLTLEENGWLGVSKLLPACAAAGQALTLEELYEVVATNDKKRFSFDESGEMIRASQGHSLPVEIDFEKKTPPQILYHGTAARNIEAILKDGLKKMNRHHVHLSADWETAQKVGARYGKPIILKIETTRMLAEDYEFFISANGVWLIDYVPTKFLKLLPKDEY